MLGAALTDDSVEVIAGVPKMRELNLYRSRITNAGLSRLGALKELTSLDLRYSRVTSGGVDPFRAAHPGTPIEFVGASAVQAGKKNSEPAGTGDKPSS